MATPTSGKKFDYAPLRMRPGDIDIVEESLHRRTLLQAKVLRKVKGGLIVEAANAQAFLPSPLLDTGAVRNAASFVGKTIHVHAVRFSPEKGLFTVGRRSVVEAQRGEERMKTLHSLRVGARMEGVACALTNFGAFVDIGGIQGLIALNAWSSKKEDHPSAYVSCGQSIGVVIKSISRVDNALRVALKPWKKPL